MYSTVKPKYDFIGFRYELALFLVTVLGEELILSKNNRTHLKLFREWKVCEVFYICWSSLEKSYLI